MHYEQDNVELVEACAQVSLIGHREQRRVNTEMNEYRNVPRIDGETVALEARCKAYNMKFSTHGTSVNEFFENPDKSFKEYDVT